MKKILLTIFLLSFSVHLFSQSPSNDNDLQKLYSQWRSFEIPPLKNGAPDYTITQFKKRDKQFKLLQKRLFGIDTTGWSISSQVDWQLVAAEMNGYDFNFRILKPWEIIRYGKKNLDIVPSKPWEKMAKTRKKKHSYKASTYGQYVAESGQYVAEAC